MSCEGTLGTSDPSLCSATISTMILRNYICAQVGPLPLEGHAGQAEEHSLVQSQVGPAQPLSYTPHVPNLTGVRNPIFYPGKTG